MAEQSEFIVMKCANCGRSLEIYPDIEHISCGYCGSRMLVRRCGGTVSLQKATESVIKDQESAEKIEAELALVRLKKELNIVLERIKENEISIDQLGSLSSGFWAILISAIVIILLNLDNWVTHILMMAMLFLIFSHIVFTVKKYRDVREHNEFRQKIATLKKKQFSLENEISRNQEILGKLK